MTQWLGVSVLGIATNKRSPRGGAVVKWLERSPLVLKVPAQNNTACAWDFSITLLFNQQ